MGQRNDPLLDLVVDAADIDRQALRDALKGVVAIDGGSGSLHLSPGFARLDAKGKLTALLLGRKALVLLGHLEDDAAAAKDLESLSGLPAGTVASTLKRLRDSRVVSQDSSKRYVIAPPKLAAAMALVSGSKEASPNA